jgi:hypothetical protein
VNLIIIACSAHLPHGVYQPGAGDRVLRSSMIQSFLRFSVHNSTNDFAGRELSSESQVSARVSVWNEKGRGLQQQDGKDQDLYSYWISRRIQQ